MILILFVIFPLMLTVIVALQLIRKLTRRQSPYLVTEADWAEMRRRRNRNFKRARKRGQTK